MAVKTSLVGVVVKNILISPLRFSSIRSLRVELRFCEIRSASTSTGASSVLSQLRKGDRGDAPSTPLGPNPRQHISPTTQTQIVSTDRSIVLGSGVQVLIHDHREMQFLKKVTAAGIFCTLMSSSALAYAWAFHLGIAAYGSLTLQMTGAGLILVAYLRSYVARASLDPRRARLVVTGSGFFGRPLASDQHVPLAMIEPGAEVTDHYIKFRLRGSMWNPACWIWYRMPRATAEGSARKPGAQVGYRILATARSDADTTGASATTSPSDTAGTISRKRFRGAGLGNDRSGVESSALPRGVTAPRLLASKAVDDMDTSRKDVTPQKSLSGLRLHHGLPLNHAEEQKILEFFDDPTAYASAGLSIS